MVTSYQKSKHVQMPSVAGMFYPNNPVRLGADIESMLAAVVSDDKPAPKAFIAPHAGYIYSGLVAASAYARWLPISKMVRKVIVMAPSHQMAFDGLAVSSADSFRTPLGDIKVDKKTVEKALQLPQVMQFDQAFTGEHALEVQLPFLQKVLKDFTLVPFIVGNATTKQVAEVLETLWGGDETRIVISSDLSHFLDYEQALVRDLRTTSIIEALKPEALQAEDACGRNPVKGLLLAAKNQNLQVETVDLRNSGDTAGDKKRVVGYGAYVFRG